MKQILVAGSLAYDYIMDFEDTFEKNILPEKLKTLSVSFLLKNLNRNFGGVAGNIAYNLSLLGQKTSIIGSGGGEDFADYKKRLAKLNINTDMLAIINDEFTANAFIMTDKNNCQITGFYPGALVHDASLSLQSNVSNLISFFVIGTTNPKAMRRFTLDTKEKKIPYLLSPAQEIGRFTKEELIESINGADIVIGNDYEITVLQKISGLSKTQILGKAKILITTLGEKGSLIETREKSISVDIAKVSKVADPTGAGDAYIAGFVAGYVNGEDLRMCGKQGAVTASFAIERYGTQNHSFTPFEFENRYSQSF